MINNLFAQSTLTTTAASTTAAAPAGGIAQSPLVGLVIWVGLFGAIMYFFMIMPQKRREKKSRDMMASLSINDTVTTIGGLTGKIIAVNDDEVTIETGIERAKVSFKKWAIKDIQPQEKV